jgi:xanthine dehydrogenase YagS FAD-binding subunit
MVAPLDGERAAYFRAISRTLAECPLVEAVVRLGVTAGTIRFARIAVGGVAPVPLRLE